MPETTYSYSLSADFPGGAIYEPNLRAEILASSIATVLSRITRSGNTINIIFANALTAGEKTTLDNNTTNPAGGLIAAHDNVFIDQSEDGLRFYKYSESASESTTTSSTFQNKLSSTTQKLPPGQYKINWYVSYTSDSTANDIEVRVQLDDTTDIGFLRYEPSDSGAPQQFGIFSGFYKHTLSVRGTFKVDIDFASRDNVNTVRVSQARLETFWIGS
jgi:hypothetical protein